MTWDFVEGSPFSNSTGNYLGQVDYLCNALASMPSFPVGSVAQADAQTQTLSRDKIISTDPPYYDNIGYADLSDFFYVWLRRPLKPIFPSLYATLATPKADELIASPYRHGGKEKAEAFFLDGMRGVLKNLAAQAHPAYPLTIYYAFKQSETTAEDGTRSSGWETFLQAVLDAGFAITGTWPMRTERDFGVKTGNNVLASSIVLACRKRAPDARIASRREFMDALNAELPEALAVMSRGGEHSPVAPVDLSQAIIGPGMAIFSRHAGVSEADGTPLTVKQALALINRFLADDDFDAGTRFCLAWFEQYGWAAGRYGEADVLARAKDTAVDAPAVAAVVESGKGYVRLLRWREYPNNWLPAQDGRPPVWQGLHQLIRVFNEGGEEPAGSLLARMPERGSAMRALAYRLYALCERRGLAEDARAYNELIITWEYIAQAAAAAGTKGTQAQLDV